MHIEELYLKRGSVWAKGYEYLRLRGTAKITDGNGGNNEVKFEISPEAVERISEILTEDFQKKFAKLAREKF